MYIRACVLTLWLCASPIEAALNNGFETDWVYATRTDWDGRPGAGALRAYSEITGGSMQELQPAGSNWSTLTFAGVGSHDARLFVARARDPDANDFMRNVEVGELDAGGNLINSVLLNQLLGVTWIGDKVAVGNIRYSHYPQHANSIFVSVVSKKNGYLPAKVYELDFGLRAILNTYTGPPMTDNAPSIDFNPNTGEMYMVAQFLGVTNSTEKPLGNADLISFAYALPGTNPASYMTLIDGESMASRDDSDHLTDPGWPHGREAVSMWHKPVAVVYRGANHEDGRETIVVSTSWDNFEMPQLEFYLDQTDADDNLVRRSTYYTKYRVWGGQLDRLTGKAWFAPLYGYTAGPGEGMVCYAPDDSVTVTSLGAQQGFSDCASPGVAPMAPGVIRTNGSLVISGNAGHANAAGVPGAPIGFETDPDIHVISYHVHDSTQLTNSLNMVQTYNKPIIVSDDNSTARTVSSVLGNIALTASLGGHYEHFDIHLGDDAGAHYGAFISSENDFPAESLAILDQLGAYASDLSPGGTLTAVDGEFLWNGQPVTLMGSSWMGALVTKMCDVDGYLYVLASHGVNLTRVWCLEQWTGTAMGTPGFEQVSWIPFEGDPGTWDLRTLNEHYYSRVVEFVRKANARGIVVQLSVFDRAGLQKRLGGSVWDVCPYNALLNIQDFLANDGGDKTYPAFTDLAPAPIWDVNEAFIRRLVGDLAGYGNVILEIMNEPHDAFPNQAQWHIAVADIIREAYGQSSGLEVSIDLGDPDVSDGLTRIEVADGNTQPVSIGGRSCRANVDAAEDHYFYFGIAALLDGAEPEVFITIDYYDTGCGQLVLQYDSTDPAPFPDNIYKHGGSVTLTNSNAWKRHTFHVIDAFLGNRQNGGADFRIAQTVAGRMYLDTVAVADIIITQDPAPLQIHQGQTAEFVVVAGGSGPFQYRWQRDGVDLTNGGKITGADAGVLRIANVRSGELGSYRCLVTSGGGRVFSGAADLTLSAPGDFDVDGDVDMADFGQFQICLSGTDNPHEPGCEYADFDGNTAVDGSDLERIRSCLAGANVEPACP